MKMFDVISVFSVGTEERERLETFADILSQCSANGVTYAVEDTYFDFGQGWKWTTIIANDSWQALSPRLQEMILCAETPEEVEECVNYYFKGTYCLDTRKANKEVV